MHRIPVASTSLRSIGYDPAQRILEIEFVHGGVYQYAGVAPEIYDGLEQAPSLGAYFHDYIRDRYAYHRVA
jgi:hypothetical protein